MGSHADGIHTVLGHGSVAAPAFDPDMQIVIGKHHGGACIVHEQTDGKLARAHMVSKGGIHLWLLQNSVLQHIPAAGQGLLAGLEHELHGSCKAIFLFFQHLCRRQQHGRVHIVAAAVGSLRVLRGEGKSALLRHGQRVHIRPQKQYLSGLSALCSLSDESRDPFSAGMGLNAVFLQLFRHVGSRFRKLKTHLRMAVKISPVLCQFLFQFQCSVIIAHAVPPFS